MTERFTPNADELLANNATYAERFDAAGQASEPSRQLAVVACMDARLDIFGILGLGSGEVHVIRNAGGIVTDDVIRSLCLSQRFLGTREIVLIHHTRCGLERLDEPRFRQELADDVGMRPTWSLGSFEDPEEDVRQSLRMLRLSPFLFHKDHVRGFVYDVETGRLGEVDDDA